jgi:hypothetical protein
MKQLTTEHASRYIQGPGRDRMPMNARDTKWCRETAPFVHVELLAEAHMLMHELPHLRLVRPLISRKVRDRKITVEGNHTEAQITLEFVGSNGIRYAVDAILRANKTERTHEDILTMYTQIFATQRDTIPLSTKLETLITHYMKGTPDLGCQWDELHVTRVDERGVHRSPVSRIRTFL